MKNFKGFSPTDKNGLGSGMVCGFLFVADIFGFLISCSMMLLGIEFRSAGMTALKDIKKETTLGGIVGFLMSCTLFMTWIHPAWILYPALILMVINIIATIKSKQNV